MRRDGEAAAALLAEIDRFQRATRMSDKALSYRAFGHGGFVKNLRNGTHPYPRSDLKMRAFINGEIARFFDVYKSA